MRFRTPFGVKSDPPRAEVERELDALQHGCDEEVFVGIERPDGSFLQIRRLPIELGDGKGRVRRASLPPGVRRMFLDFADGKPGWDDGIEWIEDPEPTGLGRLVAAWVVILAVLATVGAVAGFYLLRRLYG
jgi:hypothetical protein